VAYSTLSLKVSYRLSRYNERNRDPLCFTLSEPLVEYDQKIFMGHS